MTTSHGLHEHKPVHPHYSPTRRHLEALKNELMEQIKSQNSHISYCEDQLFNTRDKVHRLEAQVGHVLVAIGTLNALDKSGIVMKDAGQ